MPQITISTVIPQYNKCNELESIYFIDYSVRHNTKVKNAQIISPNQSLMKNSTEIDEKKLKELTYRVLESNVLHH